MVKVNTHGKLACGEGWPSCRGWKDGEGTPLKVPTLKTQYSPSPESSPDPPALKPRGSGAESCGWWTLFPSHLLLFLARCSLHLCITHAHIQVHAQHLKQTYKLHVHPASTGRMNSFNLFTFPLVLTP